MSLIDAIKDVERVMKEIAAKRNGTWTTMRVRSTFMTSHAACSGAFPPPHAQPSAAIRKISHDLTGHG
jgi:hypothetical protein